MHIRSSEAARSSSVAGVTDLKSLGAAALANGWASGSGEIESIRQDAAALGWVEVAPRRGDQTTSVLRPVAAELARTNSLSSIYGLGQQPLHTDGAHLREPPDILVLISDRPSPTSTRIWSSSDSTPPRGSPNAAFWHGMFLVRNGRDSFYAPVLDDSAVRYRYDPGCMTPCDARGRQVGQYFQEQLANAATHEWTAAGQLLVIDNRMTLHARSAVAPGDAARELTRVAFRREANR